MTAAQRKARAKLREYGVNCEILLKQAERAGSAEARRGYLAAAANLAWLALAIAPSAAPTRGAA